MIRRLLHNVVLSSALIAAACLSLPSFADEHTAFSGKVIHVKDGDSIIVAGDNGNEELRLSAIDCPEKDQPFGKEAKEFTESKCLNQKVSVTRLGHDRYHRTIANVTLPDGHNLSADLVRTGNAWWFRKYAPDDTEMQNLEKEARDRHFGLWHDEHPIAPWDWRHGVRQAEINAAARRAH
jgi:endonuclease YncB( thermonuclease family)